MDIIVDNIFFWVYNTKHVNVKPVLWDLATVFVNPTTRNVFRPRLNLCLSSDNSVGTGIHGFIYISRYFSTTRLAVYLDKISLMVNV